MYLIKDKEDFKKFQDEHISSFVEKPKEFPCYAYFIVTSWGMEEDTAHYLYKEDLLEMLDKLK